MATIVSISGRDEEGGQTIEAATDGARPKDVKMQEIVNKEVNAIQR